MEVKELWQKRQRKQEERESVWMEAVFGNKGTMAETPETIG